jgi:hypothetical protein
MPILDVYGWCPACHQPKLHRMPNGFILCLFPGCPDKAAACKVLGRKETTMAKPTETGDRTIVLEGPVHVWAEPDGEVKLSTSDPDFSTIVTLHGDSAEDALDALDKHQRKTD